MWSSLGAASTNQWLQVKENFLFLMHKVFFVSKMFFLFYSLICFVSSVDIALSSLPDTLFTSRSINFGGMVIPQELSQQQASLSRSRGAYQYCD